MQILWNPNNIDSLAMLNINNLSCLGRNRSSMYQPYDRYQQQDYQEYEPAHYQPSNPFQAHPPQGQPNDQRRNKNKRRPPCLLEHQLEYSLENFGIIEPFGMQKKIEVIVGSTTIGTIIIAGIEYLKEYGLPCTSPDRLLGKCAFISFNQDGALHGFTDLSKLIALAQEDRLAKYNQVHGKTVKGFLNHFAGSGTFYRRPDTVVQHGIRCTTLQDAMTNADAPIEGF